MDRDATIGGIPRISLEERIKEAFRKDRDLELERKVEELIKKLEQEMYHKAIMWLIEGK